MEYVEKLVKMSVAQSDIGIISPYRAQCSIIRDRCNDKKYRSIDVGPVEIFQGAEKPIIIASTVRSTDELGFLESPKRLNVLMTRAMSLLIIVGHAPTLAANKNWKHVIDFCKTNKSFIEQKI